MTNIAILGAGNIAYAIVSGLIEDGLNAANITAADPFPEQLERFAALGVVTTNNNREAVERSDIVLISVKPNHVQSVAEEIQPSFNDKTCISVAAGITAGSLESWLGSNKIIRSMPNTPALVGRGMFGLYGAPGVDANTRDLTDKLLASVGSTRWFADESQLDAVTAVSGSGPAYFFLIMEVMQDAALKLGLSPQEAEDLVQQTALGAAEMAISSHEPIATLRQNVTSPGGTTAAAVDVLQNGDIGGLFEKALIAARDRSIALSGS